MVQNESDHELSCLSKNLSRELFNSSDKSQNDLFFVGITGDGGLGKTTIANNLRLLLGTAIVVSTDGYILERSKRLLSNKLSGDDPRATNFEQIADTISAIQKRQEIYIQNYNHINGTIVASRRIKTNKVKFVIVEGAHSLSVYLRPYINYGIFLDANHQTRYNLRCNVDVQERGYTKEQFIDNWLEYDRLFAEFIYPTRKFADLLISVSKKRRYNTRCLKNCYCMG